MKKLAVLVAIVSIAALAAPAFSATNPFMDVPMNHWAYDAIGQLAAHGILSGYPDGLYKGQQQTTRYEMASALARALAVVDMTKASKQDVEMLKRLVVEFKDELEALGVRVDELDERVAVLEDRLGGWHIHGVLALDVTYRKERDNPNSKGDIKFDDAKLLIERTWGDEDQYFFRARFNGGDWATAANFDRFYVEMPFFFDSRMTVGLFAWNWEAAYKISANLGNAATGSWFGDAPITDWKWKGFGFTKNFSIGTVNLAIAHMDETAGDGTSILNGGVNNSVTHTNPWNAWMILLGFNAQFTEQFGLDIGAQAFLGDRAELRTTPADNDTAFDKMFTLWGGLHFNFNDNVALKGIYYHQKFEMDRAFTTAANPGWRSVGYNFQNNNGSWVDSSNHWAFMVDVKQEALKFTSLWLEYGQYDAGFITRSDISMFFSPTLARNQVVNDMKYWRVGLGQEWNDKWATHIFYYGYKLDNAGLNANDDWKPAEFGLGVQYKLNDSTTMGLNYMHVKDGIQGNNEYKDDNVVRMRTSISF